MKNLLSIWLLLIAPFIMFATDYTINSVDEFNDLNLSAGDTVIWENGTYSSDERITFSGNGTAANPIILKAETPGGVIFNNGLQMDIAGSYLIVDGFYWNGGYGASNFIQFRNGTTYAQNSTIQNCAINGLRAEPGDAAEAAAEGAIIKHRWIVLYGNYNNVLNCTFMNKNTAGALVLAEYEYNASLNGSSNTRCNEVGHTISNNYFYNYEKQDSSLSNAGDSETIRIGTSEYQNVNSQALISGNYFVQADGENEIITNKSMNNTYTNNTFRRCRGSLVMRHGANATVDSNYFLGENIQGTGGIRIADSDHTITNNYMQGCVATVDNTIWNNGLTFVGGNTNSVTDCSSTSVSNAYQDVENITFSNNTFVNTNSPILFNDSRDGADNVFGTVSNNVIYFENGNSNVSDVINGSYSEIGNTLTFSGNVYDGTELGESVNGFSSANLSASSNGEIYTISGAGNAGASISSLPITDSMVGNGVGACFLGAEGNGQSDCDGTVTDLLTVGSLSQFDADGGSQTFNINSNVSWTVSESTSWISINRTSGSNNGSVSVTTTENTSTNNRSATISVSGSGINRTVTVSQDGADDTTNNSTYTSIPLLIQAENFSTQSGIQTENTEDNDGGENVGYIDTGDFVSYNIDVPSSGDYTIDFRVASRSNGASFDIYSEDSVIGNISSGATGNWQIWETVSETVSLNEGEQTIRLVATGSGWNINWLNFSEEDDNQNPNTSDNLALNGTASQSTTAFNGAASRAIDGNINGSYSAASVTHTASASDSWWEVALSNQTNIGNIVIYNRTDNCCVNRLSDFTIEVFNSNGNVVYTQTITEAPSPSVTIDADGALGNRVRISNNLTNTPLSLAEVEVYAGEAANNPSTSCSAGTNLAENGTIVDFSEEQNSTNNVGNVIDGNDNNRWSAETFPQFATVDLGDEYAINEINLVTFNDRDYQFTIEGSTSSANSGFSTLVDATNNTDEGTIERSFSTQTVRYVKLTITGANSYTGQWSSIRDFKIICAGNTSAKNIADEKSLIETTIYPSPFSNEINISLNNNGAIINLIDITGKVISKQTINSNTTTIQNLDYLAKGIYFLQILDNNNQIIKIHKIIKK